MEQNPYTSPINQQQPNDMPSSGSSAGPIVGIIIVIAVLALGAWYFWGSLEQRPSDELPLIPGDEMSVENESWAPATSNSDEAAAIEADFNAFDVDEFEAYMNADAEAAASQL